MEIIQNNNWSKRPLIGQAVCKHFDFLLLVIYRVPRIQKSLRFNTGN